MISTWVCIFLAAASLPVPMKPDNETRLNLPFDDGWFFHRGDVADGQGPTTSTKGWRKVDLPHDFSIEDLPAQKAEGAPLLAVTQGEWRFHKGDDASWKAPSVDESDWEKVVLPAFWEDHSGYKEDNVYGWFRRTIQVPSNMVGREVLLALGKVDDVDETFVNGVKVGQTGQFPPNYETKYDVSRSYVLPAGLLKGDGKDVVAVRVFDGQGGGGIYEAASKPKRSGPFDSMAEGGSSTGFTPGDIGWYRKSFKVPKSWEGKSVWVTFDGAYMNTSVWLNGQKLGDNPYGYTAFRFDLTKFLNPGETNVLAVKVDSRGKNTRWYAGSGLYRRVELTVAEANHIEPWGVYVTTPEVSAAGALVKVRTTLSGSFAGTLLTTVRDSKGKKVGTSEVELNDGKEIVQEIRVEKPALWSPETPALYTATSELKAAGKVVDRVTTTFGIRSISFDATNGFLLNGKPVKMRGGCVHHDNGPLGSATYARAEERRIEVLKASGYNAVRTSHNPPSAAFLDACDRIGMLVMDESFDHWEDAKNPNDYHLYFKDWWQKDIHSMVLRDRNHPSIVLWSVGNEIIERGTPKGVETTRKLAALVHELDPTRPVTAAICASWSGQPWEELQAEAYKHLDVGGYNYLWREYVNDHGRDPQRVMIGTESFPVEAFDNWKAVLDHPYVVGDFVWTALDYIGEAGIGRAYYPGEGKGFAGEYPWTIAGCGDIDICGFKKPQSYYRDMVWSPSPKVACFVDAVPEVGKPYTVSGWGWPDERASWTWPGTEGKKRTVRVYSSCPQVRLTLNGKDLGVKPTGADQRHTATYLVSYETGTLVAVGLSSTGQELDRWTLKTAGAPAKIRLTPDRKVLSADGADLCYVKVEVLDAKGVLCPSSEDQISFKVEGEGTLLAVGSGNPKSTESFQKGKRKAFQGVCLAIIKTTKKAGSITLVASGKGLAEAKVSVSAR